MILSMVNLFNTDLLRPPRKAGNRLLPDVGNR